MTYVNEKDQGLELQQGQQSTAARKANSLANQQAGGSGYSSKWQPQLDGITDKILNREKFNYDVNADALYQQLKDQYVQQGRMAMMDTMGQAAALTGGYGNSYAQQAGQQAYQGYLQGLNEQIPDLYQTALNQYLQEGEDLYNQYAMLSEQDAQDYSRYRDDVSDQQWNQSFEYQQSRDAVSDQQWQQSFDYQQGRDAVADQQWQQSFEYQQSRDQAADDQWLKEFEENMRRYNQEYADAQAASSGSSGSSGSSVGSGSSGGSGGDDGEEGKELTRDEIVQTAVNELWAMYPGGVITDSKTWEKAASMVGGGDALRGLGFTLKASSSGGGKTVNDRDSRLF